MELLVYSPANSNQSIYDFVMQATDHISADDVVVSVPIAPVMTEVATLLNPNGMLVFFAGVPNGTLAPLDFSPVYLHNAQFTGTSGLTIDDQAQVMHRALDGSLSSACSVAAIGGMNAAQDGIQAMMDGRYPGKIVIFPQIPNLPLLGLDELSEKLPDVAAKLAEGDVWTNEVITVSGSDSDANTVAVEAYPINPVGQKLMFGARKGVVPTVVSWFWAHLEHNLA